MVNSKKLKELQESISKKKEELSDIQKQIKKANNSPDKMVELNRTAAGI